jgi:hypothetical protein
MMSSISRWQGDDHAADKKKKKTQKGNNKEESKAKENKEQRKIGKTPHSFMISFFCRCFSFFLCVCGSVLRIFSDGNRFVHTNAAKVIAHLCTNVGREGLSFTGRVCSTVPM